MSKRAVSFADSVETRNFDDSTYDPPETDELKRADDDEPVSKKKHTLDSDEEDNDDHREMDMNKVEGQEEGNMDFEGDTKITAFNMKEDLEDGHFDTDGNFIFNKKDKDSHDAWLDNIDWSAIKRKAGDQWEKDQDADDEDGGLTALTDDRRKEIYSCLISLLQPEQTITKALAAIKKKKGLSAAEERKLRWAAKKAGKAVEESSDEKTATQLSGFADEIISDGHMDAYEWPRERFEQLLKKLESTVAVDSLDMFADAPSTSSANHSDSKVEDFSSDEVLWEYRETLESEIQGPFTSAEMASRQEKGELAATGGARKVGGSDFNPVSRIDFDLYL